MLGGLGPGRFSVIAMPIMGACRGRILTEVEVDGTGETELTLDLRQAR